MNPLARLWLWLWWRCAGRRVVLTGGCRQCGQCCQQIQIQQGRSWLRSRRQFRTLVRRQPEYDRFVISGRDGSGCLLFCCRCLQPDGRCGDYANRPDICRQFPDRRLPQTGARLPASCGYQLQLARPFTAHLARSLSRPSPQPAKERS